MKTLWTSWFKWELRQLQKVVEKISNIYTFGYLSSYEFCSSVPCFNFFCLYIMHRTHAFCTYNDNMKVLYDWWAPTRGLIREQFWVSYFSNHHKLQYFAQNWVVICKEVAHQSQAWDALTRPKNLESGIFSRSLGQPSSTCCTQPYNW